jgi:excisionase family DNA binding protein
VQAVAGLLGCSPRHVYRLSDAGRMPAPVKLGSLVRWSATAIREWNDQGCPSCRKGAGRKSIPGVGRDPSRRRLRAAAGGRIRRPDRRRGTVHRQDQGHGRVQARLWGSTPAPKAEDPHPNPLPEGEETKTLPPNPPPLTPLPSGAVGSGILDKPCRCGSTEYVDVAISEGRTRRDCRKCGRFVGFGKWYDQGGIG